MRVIPTYTFLPDAQVAARLPFRQLDAMLRLDFPRAEGADIGFRRHSLFAPWLMGSLKPHVIEKLREQERGKDGSAGVPFYIDEGLPPPLKTPSRGNSHPDGQKRGSVVIDLDVDLDPTKDFTI